MQCFLRYSFRNTVKVPINKKIMYIKMFNKLVGVLSRPEPTPPKSTSANNILRNVFTK